MAGEINSTPIEDYGVIGNTLSAALVSRDGSVDWLCLPRFDSPACFAALLGGPENGHWRIAPRDRVIRRSRRYLPDTAVLETRFETETGAVTLTDFMPLSEDGERADLVRVVSGVEGRVDMEMNLIIRFEYGRSVPWVKKRDYGMSAVAGPDALNLHTGLPLSGEGLTTVSRFTIAEGDVVPLTLSYHRSHQTPHFIADHSESLDRTVSWWREWVKRGSFEAMPDKWRAPVVRSLITLKMLTYSPTGGIVAAATTSLPECIGGLRNWDYRYCWIRDAALTLYALLSSGYRDEAEKWRQWLLRAVAGDPRQLQIMYGIAGERWLPEFDVPWLRGYENTGPVRIGNGAARQMQLDVYGELIDTLHAARAAELQPHAEAWELQKALLAHLEEVWQCDDHGMWEMRGRPRAFTHSRLMCWVALDRSVIAVERFGLDGPADRWRELRDTIHADICRHGFNEQMNSFVQYYGGTALDAGLLLMPQLGFLPVDDRRVQGTIAAIEKNLMRNGFVLRYSQEDTDDGIDGEEGAFLACTYWLADAYVLSGRREDGLKLFKRLLDVGNDLGLLSEEYDVRNHRQLGNFPQAFSHIGLINTAHNLMKARGPARQRSEQEAPKGPEPVGAELEEI